MNRLTDIYKRYGLRGCLHKVIFRLGKSIGITYVQHKAYFKKLPSTIDACSLPPYRKMSMNDFMIQAEFDREWFTERKLKQIENLINRPGFSYYGLYDGDKLMGYGGISLEYDYFLNRKMEDKSAYLFDDYTNPYYRGKGLHRIIIHIREYEIWKQNKSVAFAYVLSSNPASAKGFIRCGYAAKLKLTYKQTGKNKPFKRDIIKI